MHQTFGLERQVVDLSKNRGESVYSHPNDGQYQIHIPERHIPPQNQEPQLPQRG